MSSRSDPQKHVLIVGGSGYLGQFLVDHFSKLGCYVTYTYHSSKPLPINDVAPDTTTTTSSFKKTKKIEACKVDLVTGQGLSELFMHNQTTPFDAIINCAAVSQPIACERDPSLAASINIPSKLLEILNTNGTKQTLFIHISTDQVYSGLGKSFWRETDECTPVNEYGKSKLQAEEYIKSKWENHVILRSSLIYGPQPPIVPVSRSLFLQFIENVLDSKTPTSFFTDEWRCPIFVNDIVKICDILVFSGENAPRGVFNMGGPERLSRFDMAKIVEKVKGCRENNKSLNIIVPASSSSVDRGVQSPADISVDSSLLVNALGGGWRLTHFEQAVAVLK